jgi:protein-S-isoprenylcysteine O-methyltransferase Ste14
MTPMLAKAAFVGLVVGWYVIRFPYARRSRRTPVTHSARGPRETALLLASLTGIGILPLLYVATGFPMFADYRFLPLQASFGVLVALASLAMFRLTHRALGRNWSISLDVREQHTLVTEGVYGYVRHPMYTAFWLWAVAQALLLPNWVGGFAGLVGFGILFFGRVAREERMMLESFGDKYRAYMSQTYRIIPLVY